MLLYRSIGERELNQLLHGNIVHGQYDCSREKQTTSNKTNAICCFVEKYLWKDHRHKFDVILDIPIEQIEFGEGIYYASKNLKKSRVWTGRRGKTLYKIKEGYISEYSYKNVRQIYIGNHYTNSYMEKYIFPRVKKLNLNVIDYEELMMLLKK